MHGISDRSVAMLDYELQRLVGEEKEALERYVRMKANFRRDSDVVEAARQIWEEASAAVLKGQRRNTN